MRHLAFAVLFLSACAPCGAAFAQEQAQPASPEGKSVPMQDAGSKIDTGKSKAKRHKAAHPAKRM